MRREDSVFVSNRTGQCNFLGQRDRSFFIVPGQRGTGQAQNLTKGQDELGQPVKIRDGTGRGRERYEILQPVPSREIKQDRAEE
jgi:hypothetical protein